MSARDIGRYYGVTTKTAQKWSTRYPDYPPVAAVVNGFQKLYRTADIHAWAARNAVRSKRFARPTYVRRVDAIKGDPREPIPTLVRREGAGESSDGVSCTS